MNAALRSLIIGGTGQDGSLIAQQLVADGGEVHATSRSFLSGGSIAAWQRLKIGNVVTGHRLDPADAAAVREVVAQIRPHMIFCLAGQSSVGRSFAIPIETIRSHIDPVLHVCATVRELGLDSHIVVAASGEVFGETSAARPAFENSPFAPRNPYAAGKAMAVLAAKNFREVFGLRLSIAYLFNHESPLRPADFLFGKLLAGIAAIRAGTSDHIALGNGDVARDWGWAPDYAAAMIRMAMQPTGSDFILATGQTVLLREAVSALVSASGLDASRVIHWDTVGNSRSGDAAIMAADPSRARSLLGWNGSVSFPELAHRLLNEDMSQSCK